jgi:hypothetical protein
MTKPVAFKELGKIIDNGAGNRDREWRPVRGVVEEVRHESKNIQMCSLCFLA